ncbi:MAG: Chemotaxis protein [Pseudomonadota bacterium]|jgi:two-component system chemotaxis sensor kinase CheA
MEIDISQFTQIFFEEVEELLDDLERLLLKVDVESPDSEDINAIFRIAHSIKGGAATFGYVDLASITHELESMLDKIRHGDAQFTVQHQEVLLQSKDVLKMQLDGLRFDKSVDQEKIADIRVILAAMANNQLLPAKVSAPAASVKSSYLKHFQLKCPLLSAQDIKALTEELSLLGELSASVSDTQHTRLNLWTNETSEDVLVMCSFIVDTDTVTINEYSGDHVQNVNAQADSGLLDVPPTDAPLKIKPLRAALVERPIKKISALASGAVGATESSTVRVSIEKVNQLINMVGELVIAHAMIVKSAETLDPLVNEMLLHGITQLGISSHHLQESAMSMRLMPMDIIFSRFPRMVRELSSKLGKKIILEIEGNTIELDKGQIEKILDPLTHLIKNSIDHGIERPEVRVQAGKPEEAKLGLSAEHHGGYIVIKVSDDGAGLNRLKIIEKAQALGLFVRDTMSDAEVWQFIFTPGFSTAETITNISGNGTGMEMVKRNITSLGGTVNIQSTAGKGTTTTVFIPLTLAILDGMSVKVGQETYLLPLYNVLESFQPVAASIKEVSGQGTLINVRGEYLPVILLFEVFTIEPIHRDLETGILVVVEAEGRKAALFVDELVDQQQIVVKSIEANYHKIPNISGATILADGSVAFIIDVVGLIN